MKPFLILGVGLVLWILSIYLVHKWKYFWGFLRYKFCNISHLHHLHNLWKFRFFRT